jgi:hypothetical protein
MVLPLATIIADLLFRRLSFKLGLATGAKTH